MIDIVQPRSRLRFLDQYEYVKKCINEAGKETVGFQNQYQIGQPAWWSKEFEENVKIRLSKLVTNFSTVKIESIIPE